MSRRRGPRIYVADYVIVVFIVGTAAATIRSFQFGNKLGEFCFSGFLAGFVTVLAVVWWQRRKWQRMHRDDDD